MGIKYFWLWYVFHNIMPLSCWLSLHYWLSKLFYRNNTLIITFCLKNIFFFPFEILYLSGKRKCPDETKPLRRVNCLFLSHPKTRINSELFSLLLCHSVFMEYTIYLGAILTIVCWAVNLCYFFTSQEAIYSKASGKSQGCPLVTLDCPMPAAFRQHASE